MAQTKKAKVNQAILDAAYRLFSERGYSRTNILAIAKAANVSPANVYVYFSSKLDILFSIYQPWLTKHFDELERSLKPISDPAQRLKKILSVLWRDIPAADNGFANNMMQTFSTTTIREGYSPALRIAVEKRLARLLEESLPKLERTAARDLANVFLMAFDGYILNYHLNEKATCSTRRLDTVVRFVLAASDAHLAAPTSVRGATEKSAALASGAR